MSMSRKDFELIARTLKDARSSADSAPEVGQTDHIAERIATALVGHSSTFDKTRFLAACRPKEKS